MTNSSLVHAFSLFNKYSCCSLPSLSHTCKQDTHTPHYYSILKIQIDYSASLCKLIFTINYCDQYSVDL